jgi:hypothetical protein
MTAYGGATSGDGIFAGGGGSGCGITAAGTDSNNYGFYAIGSGAVDSGGIKGVALNDGEGMELTAAGAGHHGLYITGGSGTGKGIYVDDIEVTGTTVMTGAVTMPAGLTANITGTLSDLSSTARAEPGQGAPAVNASLAAKVDYLYKAWRNKRTQTATLLAIYNDAGAVVDQKATVSDDGTTTTVEEIVSGP